MKRFFDKFLALPIWCGICVVLIYAILTAEYISEVNRFLWTQAVEMMGIIKTIMRLSYVAAVLSSFAVWVVQALLFHLVALLLDGNQKFSKLLFATTFPYVFPAVSTFVAILLLDGVNVDDSKNVMEELTNNSRFQIITYVVNGSFVPFYLMVVCIIHYLYKINWIRSFMSVIIPVASIWGVTELFTLL